jgi:flagellar basal body L-ring protein FlgH
MAFVGNLPCLIEKLSGFDEFGQPLASKKIKSRCSIVKLVVQDMRTSVRTDTSATGGNAHEYAGDSRLLFDLSAPIEVGDIITVSGITLQADAKFYRNSVNGKGHHWQVDASIHNKS